MVLQEIKVKTKKLLKSQLLVPMVTEIARKKNPQNRKTCISKLEKVCHKPAREVGIQQKVKIFL